MMPAEKPGMAPAFRDLILHPGDFFRDLANAPPAYGIPALIIVIWGIISAIQTFQLISWMMDAFVLAAPHQQGTELMAVIFAAISVMAGVFALPMAFVYWGAAALGLYLIGGIFSRTGSIRHTFTATAWGMIPLAIGNAIQVLVFLAYKKAMVFTISPEFFNLTMKSQKAGYYSPMSSSEMAKYVTFNHAFYEYSLISFVLLSLALLGSAWFWFHALQHTRSLTRKQAAITVFVPVVLLLGVILVSRIISGWT
jgi:hypothetical protein